MKTLNVVLPIIFALLLAGCAGGAPIIGKPGEAPPENLRETRITCYQGGGAMSGVGVGSAQGSFNGVRIVQANEFDGEVSYNCGDDKTVNIKPKQQSENTNHSQP